MMWDTLICNIITTNQTRSSDSLFPFPSNSLSHVSLSLPPSPLSPPYFPSFSSPLSTLRLLNFLFSHYTFNLLLRPNFHFHFPFLLFFLTFLFSFYLSTFHTLIPLFLFLFYSFTVYFPNLIFFMFMYLYTLRSGL